MVDIKLDPVTHDIDLSSGGFELVDGVDAIRQHVAIRLQFFQGEYFLDESRGVPYFTDILVKNPDLVLIRSIFRQVILETPGVISITDYQLDLDAALRELSVSFFAQVDGSDQVLNFEQTFQIGV